MYAKSMLEFARARAIERGWLNYLYGAPVVLALAVAALPFALERDSGGLFSLSSRAAEAIATAGVEQIQAAPRLVALVTPPKLVACVISFAASHTFSAVAASPLISNESTAPKPFMNDLARACCESVGRPG